MLPRETLEAMQAQNEAGNPLDPNQAADVLNDLIAFRTALEKTLARYTDIPEVQSAVDALMHDDLDHALKMLDHLCSTFRMLEDRVLQSMGMGRLDERKPASR